MRHPRRDRDRAPAGRSPRRAGRVPGVLHGAVRAVLVRRAHRELVHVRLAREERVGGLQSGDDRGVVRRDVPSRDLPSPPWSSRRARAERVLQRDRNARERPERFPARPLRVDGLGLREHLVARDLQEGVERRIARVRCVASVASATSTALISPRCGRFSASLTTPSASSSALTVASLLCGAPSSTNARHRELPLARARGACAMRVLVRAGTPGCTSSRPQPGGAFGLRHHLRRRRGRSPCRARRSSPTYFKIPQRPPP